MRILQIINASVPQIPDASHIFSGKTSFAMKRVGWGASLRAHCRLPVHEFGGQRTGRPANLFDFVCHLDNPESKVIQPGLVP
jgi:hypothetical protein